MRASQIGSLSVSQLTWPERAPSSRVRIHRCESWARSPSQIVLRPPGPSTRSRGCLVTASLRSWLRPYLSAPPRHSGEAGQLGDENLDTWEEDRGGRRVSGRAAGASVGVGRWAGGSAAHATIRRLSVLWPNVMEMPQDDRALLAWLSIKCELLRQPENEGSTVRCLRQAAASDTASEAFQAPAAQLEHLLRKAQRVPGA